ncbi:MAG: NAD(P)-dependent oxidoreductase [Inquilinaceae bacterium]
MTAFRVALSGDFLKPDGTPAYPDFDLEPLRRHPGVECAYIPADGGIKAEALDGFDALILLAARCDRASLPGDGRLALVARFGVGYDSVDVPACTDAGVAVAITPDGVRRPVAVAILTLMLALSGRLLAKDRITRQGPEGWTRRSAHMGVGLTGKVLGSIGIGNIGAEMFRLARPLDMTFIAHDPMADPEVAKSLGVRLVDLDALFAEADVLAVNCPLTDKTRGLVDARRLALMKPTAFLINTARGPIVDQAALTRALSTGALAGAGLDVFEDEPPAADDPLLALDNVVVTPHALCWTDECFARIGAADVRAVLDVMHGRVPLGLVNAAIADDPAWRAKLERHRAMFGD